MLLHFVIIIQLFCSLYVFRFKTLVSEKVNKLDAKRKKESKLVPVLFLHTHT